MEWGHLVKFYCKQSNNHEIINIIAVCLKKVRENNTQHKASSLKKKLYDEILNTKKIILSIIVQQSTNNWPKISYFLIFVGEFVVVWPW